MNFRSDQFLSLQSSIWFTFRQTTQPFIKLKLGNPGRGSGRSMVTHSCHSWSLKFVLGAVQSIPKTRVLYGFIWFCDNWIQLDWIWKTWRWQHVAWQFWIYLSFAAALIGIPAVVGANHNFPALFCWTSEISRCSLTWAMKRWHKATSGNTKPNQNCKAMESMACSGSQAFHRKNGHPTCRGAVVSAAGLGL